MAEIFVKKTRNVPLSRMAVFVKKTRNVPHSRIDEFIAKKMRIVRLFRMADIFAEKQGTFLS